MTTVGYGDFYPVSTEGRLLAGVLMSAGVGIFGVFTVKCTQILLHSAHEEDEKHLDEIQTELKQMRSEIKELKALLLNLSPSVFYEETPSSKTSSVLPPNLNIQANLRPDSSSPLPSDAPSDTSPD